jgi:hypothetical protein
MKSHAEIIAELGGIRAVAGALKHKNHTTVQGWHERNKIPQEHWAAIIQAASALEKPLTVAELLPPGLAA